MLGVPRDATQDEIKKAFRRLARETHPDANPGDPEAEARFRASAEAYEVLSDTDRRTRYDRGDAIDLGDLLSGGLEDLIASVFGDSGFFGATTRAASRRRGRDILVAAEITLDEALHIFSQPKVFRRGGRNMAAKGPLREFGTDPVSERPVVAKDGRFGVYVTDGETNASLGRGDRLEEMTAARAYELLAIRRDVVAAKGGPAKRRAPAKKATAKKAATKRKPAKKATAKKATAKKAAAKQRAAKEPAAQDTTGGAGATDAASSPTE